MDLYIVKWLDNKKQTFKTFMDKVEADKFVQIMKKSFSDVEIVKNSTQK